MSEDALAVVAQVFECYMKGDIDSLQSLLAPDITWRGTEPESACHNRTEVLDFLSWQRELGLRPILDETLEVGHRVLAVITVPAIPGMEGREHDERGYHVAAVRNGRIASIQDYPDRELALEACRED